MGERFPEYDEWLAAEKAEKEEHWRRVKELEGDPKESAAVRPGKAGRQEGVGGSQGQAGVTSGSPFDTAPQARSEKGGQERALSLWQRQEIQELLHEEMSEDHGPDRRSPLLPKAGETCGQAMWVKAAGGWRQLHSEIVPIPLVLPRDMDGYQVARRLREKPEFKTVTLCALTGFTPSEADHQRQEQTGFDHYYVKPVSVETLLDLFKTVGQQQTQLPGPACDGERGTHPQ